MVAGLSNQPTKTQGRRPGYLTYIYKYIYVCVYIYIHLQAVPLNCPLTWLALKTSVRKAERFVRLIVTAAI
jgi:hypothetical protein